MGTLYYMNRNECKEFQQVYKTNCLYPMYTDFGMITGVHYIAYDGSLEDFKRKAEYYIEHEEELERIAESGYTFIQSQLKKKYSMRYFYKNEVDFTRKKEVINENI